MIPRIFFKNTRRKPIITQRGKCINNSPTCVGKFELEKENQVFECYNNTIVNQADPISYNYEYKVPVLLIIALFQILGTFCMKRKH